MATNTKLTLAYLIIILAKQNTQFWLENFIDHQVGKSKNNFCLKMRESK
jgi:hypothetical protein